MTSLASIGRPLENRVLKIMEKIRDLRQSPRWLDNNNPRQKLAGKLRRWRWQRSYSYRSAVVITVRRDPFVATATAASGVMAPCGSCLAKSIPKRARSPHPRHLWYPIRSPVGKRIVPGEYQLLANR